MFPLIHTRPSPERSVRKCPPVLTPRLLWFGQVMNPFTPPVEVRSVSGDLAYQPGMA